MTGPVIRVAVIGNSHVEAIAAGEAGAAMEDVSARYFGASAQRIGGLRVEAGALVADDEELRRNIVKSSGGLDRIVGADYDHFILAGMDVALHHVTNIYLSHRLAEHGERGRQLVSRAAFDQAVEDTVLGTQGFGMVARVRAISDASVSLFAAPLPHPRIADPAMARGRWAGPWLSTLNDAYQQALERIAAREGVSFFTQPAETIQPPAFTRPDFCHEDEKASLHHANGAYGALMWRQWRAAQPVPA